MARITVEGCMQHVKNRFELVLVAAHRAKEISAGKTIRVSRHDDKNSVIALREIEASLVPIEEIREIAIRVFQKTPFVGEHDLQEANLLDMLHSSKEIEFASDDDGDFDDDHNEDEDLDDTDDKTENKRFVFDERDCAEMGGSYKNGGSFMQNEDL